jgi:hypothetical protein
MLRYSFMELMQHNIDFNLHFRMNMKRTHECHSFIINNTYNLQCFYVTCNRVFTTNSVR